MKFNWEDITFFDWSGYKSVADMPRINTTAIIKPINPDRELGNMISPEHSRTDYQHYYQNYKYPLWYIRNICKEDIRYK